VTQQGDVVRIRLRGSAGISVAGATATGSAALAAYGAVSAFSKSRFSVDVNGSLNATS